MTRHDENRDPKKRCGRLLRWGVLALIVAVTSAGILVLGTGTPPVLAAGVSASVTARATRVPNSYRLAVSAGDLASGDVVDVQVVNQKTGNMIQQFYQTATGSTLLFVDNTEALPADTPIAYTVFIHQPGWGPVIATMSDLDPIVTSSTAPTLQDQALAFYPNWIRQYVHLASHGGLRVVNSSQGHVTVSEGQGYGMLIAALANDAPTFAGLWDYAQQHLDAHGLMNWEIGPSGMTLGKTSATNGDETMAQALIMAGWRWPGNGYGRAGIKMANAIYHYDLRANLLVAPGDAWAGPQTANDIAPGYIDPYAYQVFAHADGYGRWQKVLTTNLRWLGTIGANPTTGLVPDWETIGGQPVVPPGSNNPSRADAFYDNAAPYPIWMAQWVKRSAPNSLAQTLAHFLATARLSDGYTLTGTPLSSGYTNLPFLTGTAVLTTAVDPQSVASHADLNQLVTQQANSYYGAVLKALGLFILADPLVEGPLHVTVPPAIAANTPFHVTVSNIPASTQDISLVLPSTGDRPQAYTIATESISSGQSSVTLTVTMPRSLTSATKSYPLLGGPHTLEVDFLNRSGVLRVRSATVNITGVPTDQVRDDRSPYHLSYNPNTSKITITHVPSHSTITVSFRATGRPEGDASHTVLGSFTAVGPGTITLTVHGIPHQSGYLEADIAHNAGRPVDTNELSLAFGIPVGQAPEVSWAALLPTMGVGVVLVMTQKRRKA